MIKQSYEMLSPHAEKLNELIALQSNTDIASLAPVVPPRNTLIRLLSGQQTPVLDVAVLARKIENWSEYLLSSWINATKNIKHEQLEKLKLVALKIHEEKKIGFIRKALNNLNINDDRINTALANLENRITIILAPAHSKEAITPALIIEKHPQMGFDVSYSPPDSDTFKYLPARSFSETDAEKPNFNGHYYRKFSRQIDARILDMQTQTEQTKALLVKMRELHMRIKREVPSEYGRFLSIIKSTEEWQAYGQVLTPEEANEFLGHLLNDINLHQYIPRFIIFLRFDVLESVLQGCMMDQINMINHIFFKSPDIKQNWFITRFVKLRELFVDISNGLGREIDKLNAKYRAIKPVEIRLHDIQKMDELVSEIQLHKQSFQAFASIIRGAITDHTTIEVLTGKPEKRSNLDAAYLLHQKRLSYDPKDWGEEGYPYEIINGIIFGQPQKPGEKKADDKEEDYLEDSDDAAEIYGNWGILDAKAYEEVGLVHHIPEKVRRDWIADPSAPHKMGRCFALKKLAKLHGGDPKLNGIYLWKHLRIYNKFMLKQYLNSPEMQFHFTYENLYNEFVKQPRVEDID